MEGKFRCLRSPRGSSPRAAIAARYDGIPDVLPAAGAAGKPASAENPSAAAPRAARLMSLDLLRGLDIFMLVAICDSGLVYAAGRRWHWPKWLMDQFAHPDWVGFSLHDLIMPLFIFMAGAALPLALKKRLNPDGTAGARYWGHVLSRVALLWFWGMVVQGRLLTFDLAQISFFNNTLQTIAVGYLVSAAVARIPSRAVRIAVPFALAALYTVLLHTLGDMTPTGNFAVVYETRLLRLLYPESLWNGFCVTQIAKMHYTWWTTIPMFGVMSLAGCLATEIVLGDRPGPRKAGLLAAVGAGLLALGGALLPFDPCVKHIFTASFTALAMGCSYLLFAACYLFADVWNVRRGYSLILLYGRRSLMAYLLGGVFSGVASSLVATFYTAGQERRYGLGLARFLPPDVAPVVWCLLTAVAVTVLLHLRETWGRGQKKGQRLT